MFNIDVIIFVAFLALNLIVGLRYGRNVKNIGDYALGGRNFSTGALVATIVATWIGGGSFFITTSKTYSDGLYYVIPSWGMSLCFLIVAFVFVPRMASFLGKLSIGEVMGDLYGNKVRVITAVAGTIGSAGAVAIQFKAFGNIFTQFLEFPSIVAIISAGSIVTIYSAFGGIRSVTFTDILQFCAFGVAIPIIGVVLWEKLYGTPAFSITKAFASPKFNLSEVINFGNPKFWETLPLMLYFAMPGLKPAFFQRILIGKDIGQVKKAFIISACFIFLIELSLAWIPFLMFNVNPDLESGSLLPYIIKNYAFTGLKGLVIISIVAMSMSTADSAINASAVLFSHDFCSVFGIGKKRKLLLAKLFSFALGGASMLLAIYSKDLLQIILTVNSFYMPIVTVPLMVSILGFRTSRFCVLAGMAAGFTTVVVWKIKGIEMDCIVIAMCVNFLVLTASHYLTGAEGGWVACLADSEEEKGSGFLEKLKNFDPADFFRAILPKNELAYSGLGLFCIFYTFGTMYSAHLELTKGGALVLYQIMLCASFFLLFYPAWPQAMRKFDIIPKILWHFAIFFMLCLLGTFFLLSSDFGRLQMAIFSINAVSTVALAGWKRGAVLIALGLYGGTKLFAYYGGKSGLKTASGEPMLLALYALILITGSVLIFFRPKETEYVLAQGRVRHLAEMLRIAGDPIAKAKKMREEFIKNIQHETNNPLTGITSVADTLYGAYDRLKEKDIKDGLATILASSVRLETFANNLINLSKAANGKLDPQISSVDLSSLLTHRVEICKKLHGANEKQEFTLKIDGDIFMDGDKNYLACAFDNIILNAINYCAKGEIKIGLKKIGKDIEFSVEDQGIGIPEGELSGIFDSFEVSSKTRTPAGGRGVGLSFAKAVAEFHGGTIKAEPGRKRGAKFTVLFDRS